MEKKIGHVEKMLLSSKINFHKLNYAMKLLSNTTGSNTINNLTKIFQHALLLMRADQEISLSPKNQNTVFAHQSLGTFIKVDQFPTL